MPPETSEPRNRALPSPSRPRRTSSASSSRDPRDRLVDLLLGEVAEHDRDLEPSQEEERELPRHEPRADDADPLHAPRLGVRHAHASLRAALHEVERVDGRLGLGPWEELRERVLLGAIALLERPGGGALDEVERPVGRGRRAVHLSVETRPRLAADLDDVREIGRRPPLARALLDLSSRNASDSSRNSTGSSSASANPASNAFGAVEHAVLAERVLDDERHRLLGSDELRDELRAPPAGDEAEEHLRAGEVPHRGRDRPVVAVQRDLDATADAQRR